jgi:hypothetical protein
MPLFAIKKAGTYRLDIIPYEVQEDGVNPHADKGNLYFERTYWTHRGVGAEQNSYVCLRKTAKLPCPICEFRAEASRDPNATKETELLVKSLEPKERQLWNVIDLSEPDKGVQLWEVSHHLFGKYLDNKVRAGDDNEYDNFADPIEGLTIKITYEQKSQGGYNFFSPTDIEFKARKEAYDEDIIEKAANLDAVPRLYDYDELKDIFLQQDSSKDDEEEEKPKKGGKVAGKAPAKKPVPADDDDDEDDEEEEDAAPKFKLGDMVEHEELGVCKVVHISGDGTSLRLEDKKKVIHKAIDPDDCEPVKGKEEKKPASTKPTSAGKAPSKKPSTEDDDEDDFPDDDEEDDDEDDEDDDDGEEEEEEEEEKPAKKPTGKTPAKKPASKKPAVDDDDDW